jgi:hypothetical protein
VVVLAAAASLGVRRRPSPALASFGVSETPMSQLAVATQGRTQMKKRMVLILIGCIVLAALLFVAASAA